MRVLAFARQAQVKLGTVRSLDKQFFMRVTEYQLNAYERGMSKNLILQRASGTVATFQ